MNHDELLKILSSARHFPVSNLQRIGNAEPVRVQAPPVERLTLEALLEALPPAMPTRERRQLWAAVSDHFRMG